ncbi:MAG: DUF4091 domain-containing protein [Pirellulales bacterium]|nr:DUF4091 domain-containing protein [Pirellulales bacterium]
MPQAQNQVSTTSARLVLWASRSLLAASLTAGSSLAGAEIRMHPIDEPEPFSALDGLENFFRGSKVAVSGHWSDRVGTLAVDGRHDQPGEHWGCEGAPVHLTVELPQPRMLNTIRLWTFWNGKRAYQYVVEGSADGVAWSMLADRRRNASPANAEGDTLSFPAAEFRCVRTTILGNSESGTGGHIVEIEGYHVPPELSELLAARDKAWKMVPPGLHGAFASKDNRYARETVPAKDGQATWSAAAWRGERVATQLVLWTSSGAQNVRLGAGRLGTATGQEIPAGCVRPQFVRYVLSDHVAGDGTPGSPGSCGPVADVLDTRERLSLPAGTARPVWLTIDVPADSAPGRYTGHVLAAADTGPPLRFPIELEVLPLVLPQPDKWAFRLDIWQDPWSVAQYHGVAPWSEAHWKILEPHLRLLADTGQKFITTYCIAEAWGESTYINNGTMIQWTRKSDGRFVFDYTRFDQYVELARKCGITDAITCYTMLPWGHRHCYLDESTGNCVWPVWKPDSPEYKAAWTVFLKDFAAHLQQRGWFDRTYIGINESPWEDGRHSIDLLKAAAPGLKVTWAGRYHEQLKDDIDDWCFFITPQVDEAIIAGRVKEGRPTTFYVCCGPSQPNTFTYSPPAEAAWLGWHAAARGYSGFLRWAYDSWVENPLYDTRYVRWPAGDCFMIYPGPRSSIRFERMREGIADYEKVRIVRRVLGDRGDGKSTGSLKRLDEMLARFTYDAAQTTPAAEVVRDAQRLLVDLSRQAAQPGPSP